MRVLLVDGPESLLLDIAMRSQRHGHATKWFFPKTEKNKFVGRGLVEIVPDWREYIRWADIVICSDNTRYLRELDAWRKRGIRIVGATSESARSELDRTFGQALFKKAGMDVAPYREFSNYDAAIAYVKREDRRFVSKPCGDEPDKSLSYVAKSPEDLVYMLQRWKKAQKLKGKFILQEFVGGVEMAVGGWFGPGGFNEGFLENFEFKKIAAGDVGQNCGESGTVMRITKKSKLADMVLKPLEDYLSETGHVGYFDTNCIIDDEGTPWPLEATARAGWPTFNIQQILMKGDIIEYLSVLADGKDARTWKLNEVAAGVVMAIGDYPFSHMTRKEVVGVPIYGYEKVRDEICLCEAMMGTAPQKRDGRIVDAPMVVTAGDYVLVCVGSGATVSEATGRTYTMVDKIEMPASPQYRVDIGRRLSRQLPKVQAHGFATGWKY